VCINLPIPQINSSYLFGLISWRFYLSSPRFTIVYLNWLMLQSCISSRCVDRGFWFSSRWECKLSMMLVRKFLQYKWFKQRMMAERVRDRYKDHPVRAKNLCIICTQSEGTFKSSSSSSPVSFFWPIWNHLVLAWYKYEQTKKLFINYTHTFYSLDFLKPAK